MDKEVAAKHCMPRGGGNKVLYGGSKAVNSYNDSNSAMCALMYFKGEGGES